MSRIAIVQAEFGLGGGQAVCAHTIDALAGDHELTVFAWDAPDAARLDAWFGTRLGTRRFRVVPTGPRFGYLPRRLLGSRLLRYALTLRHAQENAHDFDLVISIGAEIRVERPAMQYLHVPLFAPRARYVWLEGRPAGPLREAAWRVWKWLARTVARGSVDAYRRNTTLVNSAWTAERVRETLEVEATVVWPPVAYDGGGGEPGWEARENGFVVVGRLSPAKRQLEVMDCVAELRRAGHDVHLHVVGPGDGEYARAVIDRCARSDFASYDGTLGQHELMRLVAAHRYGINGCRYEHFGIAVAQMVMAGCVVFAPAEGGQVELLGGDARLLFGDFADAPERIAPVLRDEGLQHALRDVLAGPRAQLLAHDFQARIAALVRSA